MHADAGVEVRRVFHQLRSHALEYFNGQVKAIFDTRPAVPTRGLLTTRRYLLLHRLLSGRCLNLHTGLESMGRCT